MQCGILQHQAELWLWASSQKCPDLVHVRILTEWTQELGRSYGGVVSFAMFHRAFSGNIMTCLRERLCKAGWWEPLLARRCQRQVFGSSGHHLVEWQAQHFNWSLGYSTQTVGMLFHSPNHKKASSLLAAYGWRVGLAFRQLCIMHVRCNFTQEHTYLDTCRQVEQPRLCKCLAFSSTLVLADARCTLVQLPAQAQKQPYVHAHSQGQIFMQPGLKSA